MNYIESIADRLKASALSLNSGWELKPENYADIMEAVKKINVNQTEMKRCLISAAINITRMTLANNNVLSADEKNQVFLISSRIAAYAVCAKCGFEDKSILGSYRNDIEYGRYSQAVMNAVSQTAAKTVHLTLGSVEKNVKISNERINEYERSLFPADRTGDSFGYEYDRGRSDGVPQNVGSYAERQSDGGRSTGTSPLETEYGYPAERTGQIRRNEEISAYREESVPFSVNDGQRGDYGVSGERAGEVREADRKSDDNVSGVGQQIRDGRPADEVGTLGEISSGGFNIGAESGTNSIAELETKLYSLSSEIENKRKEAVRLISEDKVAEAGEVLSEIASLKENSERISAELEKAKQAIPEGFTHITEETAKEMELYRFGVRNIGSDYFADNNDLSKYIEMTLIANAIHDISTKYSKHTGKSSVLDLDRNSGTYYWDKYTTILSPYENVMKALNEGDLSPVENYIAVAESMFLDNEINAVDSNDIVAVNRAMEHFTKFKEITGAFEQSDVSKEAAAHESTSDMYTIDRGYELLHHLVSEDERVINAALNSDRQNLTNEIKAVMAKKALAILTENPKNNSAFYNDFSSDNKSGRYDDTFNAVLETVLERAEQQKAADFKEDVTEDVTETIRNAVAEILSHDDKLRISAKNNSYNDFSFAYYSRVEDILLELLDKENSPENMQTEIAALLDNDKYLHDVFSEYDSFLTGYAFESNDLMRVIAKNGLAWDEIESIGYDLYEQGYIDRHAPSDRTMYGNGMSERQLYDFARRMNNGEDIRAVLAKALIGGQKNNKIEFVTSRGEFRTDTYNYGNIPVQSMQVHFGEDTVTAVCGNIRREISYAEMGQAFLDLAKGEYDDIVQSRTVDELRDNIDGLSVQEAVGLISAFDGATTHGWNEESLTNNAKINRIKKALYNILGDEEKTEKAFVSIADMKYNYKVKSAPTAERAKEETPAAMNTAMPEVTKSSARTSYPTPHKKSKNGDTIIGNTVFKYIPHKTRTDVSNDIVDEIEKELVNRNIKFSGVIKADGATITVSKENQPVLQDIISLLSDKETAKEDEGITAPAETAEKVVENPPETEETVTDTTEKSADEEKPMTTDDISVGDRFLYKGREYTVTSMQGVYPDDIGVSYIEGTGSAAFEVTQNIDKFRLAREGKYLGREEEKTETFDVRMSRTLNVSNGVSVYVSGSEVNNLHSYIYGTYPSYDEAASTMIDIRRAMENDTALRDEYFSKCPYYERDIMLNMEVEIDGTVYVVTDIDRRSDSITLSDENENFINRRFSDIDRIVNEQSYEQTESIESKGVGKTVDELEVGDVIRFNGKEVTITEINGDFTIWFDNDGGAIIGNWKKEFERMGYEYIPQDKSVNLENSPTGNFEKDEITEALDLDNNTLMFSVISIDGNDPFVVGGFVDEDYITELDEYRDYVIENSLTEVDVTVNFYQLGNKDNEAENAVDSDIDYISEHLDEVLSHRSAIRLEVNDYSIETPTSILNELTDDDWDVIEAQRPLDEDISAVDVDTAVSMWECGLEVYYHGELIPLKSDGEQGLSAFSKAGINDNFYVNTEDLQNFRIADEIASDIWDMNKEFNSVPNEVGQPYFLSLEHDHEEWDGYMTGYNEYENTIMTLFAGDFYSVENYLENIISSKDVSEETRETAEKALERVNTFKEQSGIPEKERREEIDEDTPTVDSSFRYTILLVKSGDEYRDYRFSDFEDLQRYGKTPNRDSLTEVYSGNVEDISNALNDFAALDSIYEVFNTRHPDDYNNRSLSVGDIVLLERNNEARAYMVSSTGFRDVSEYILNKSLENAAPEKESELLTALEEHRNVYFKDEPPKPSYLLNARDVIITNQHITYNEETGSFEMRGDVRDNSLRHIENAYLRDFSTPFEAELYITSHNLVIDHIDGGDKPIIENSPTGNFVEDRETGTSEIKFGDEFIAPETEQLDLFSVNPAEKAMENLSAWGGVAPKEEKPTTEELFAQAGISADNPPTVSPEVEAEILEQRMNDISGNGVLSDIPPVMEREYTEEKIPDIEENPLAVSPELEAEVREFLGNLENPFTPEQEEKIAKGLEELFSDTPETEIPRSVDTTAEKGKNFVITDDNFGVAGGEKSRFIANIEAIRTLKTIEAKNRTATPEEQQILSKFTGWGAISQAFDDSNSKWSKEYEELKELLTPEEYAAAARSTMNAHYTTPLVISAIYEGLKNLGFESGKILEPAMGIGNFFGMLPENMRDSELYGVELDSITGRIAKQLYPEANIQVKGFEKTEYKDSSFDVAVGNVPFGSYQLNDRRYNDNKFMIHDYFFAKALDKVHSGGVIAFVTSQGTMDKESEKVREYIAQRAELLGAIRLPGGRNGAFKENAGTEVTTDIIFLQKRDRPIEINPDEVGWIHKAENADGFSINNYFVEHPEMVLGKIIAGNKMYANQENDTSCEAFPDKDLKELLANAVKSLNGAYRSAEIEVSPEDKDSIPAPAGSRKFSYQVVDGELYFREDTSMMKKVEAPKDRIERAVKLVEIRDTVHELLNMQINNAGHRLDAEIAECRAKLNTLYDSFVKKYGNISGRKNAKAMEGDNGYNICAALENKDEKGKVTGKADIFEKDTIKPKILVDHVETAEEALILSISEKAHIDFEYMSEISGMDRDMLISELEGQIFRLPSDPDKYVTSDEYLTGNIRKKIKEIENCGNPEEFADNLEALQRAMPKRVEAKDIDVRLGAHWVDPKYIRDFIIEKFKPDTKTRCQMTVEYSRATGKWKVDNVTATAKKKYEASTTYGTSRKQAYEIIEGILNNSDLTVRDRVCDKYGYPIRDEKGNYVLVPNFEETKKVESIAKLIKEEFKDWIFAEKDRRDALVDLYNEVFNSIRHREYDGSHLNFVGMNPEIKLREHQMNAVARGLFGGNTMLAHAVGAGKSYEMIAIAMEGKRLGLHSKCLFAVPKSLTRQMGDDFLKLYPNANILVATEKDFKPENRKRLLANMAANDWDAVIVGHSQFDRMGLSPEREVMYLQEEIAKLRAERMAAIAENGKKSHTVKQIERAIKAYETKLEKTLEAQKKDDFIDFEQLGFDKVFVDESHMYKNLATPTKMHNVAGLGSGGSARAFNLLMKCKYLDEKTGSHGLIFSSGTPVSNSMTELYTLMRYLQADLLRDVGIQHFDEWAADFGEVIKDYELKPESDGKYQLKTRFAKFTNLPELMGMFKEAADIRTADTLNLEKPVAHFHDVVAEPSKVQKRLIKALGKRATKIRNGKVDPTIDNMLKITTDGRKIGLDQRIINPNFPDNPDSKVNMCVRNVAEIYRQTTERKGTQCIFCDLSTPKTESRQDRFIVYRPNPNTESGFDIIRKKMGLKQDKGEMGFTEIKKYIDDNTKGEGNENDRLKEGDIVVIRKPSEDMTQVISEAAVFENGKLNSINSIDLLASLGMSDIEDMPPKEFNVYDDIKSKLIEQGIPESEIAFIHDYDTAEKKQALFNQMNAGDVRILLGSTSKCGAGMNAQKKMVALHHLDAALRPSDMEQRQGRIERQGNENKEVDIYRYVTNKTFDSYLYQLLENKQKFISQIMTSKTPERTCSDIDETALDYAEVKSLCAGNPLIREEMDLQIRIKDLKMERSHYNEKIFDMQDKLSSTIPEDIKISKIMLKHLRQDLEIARSAPTVTTEEGKEIHPIKIGGKVYNDRKAGGNAIRSAIKANMAVLSEGKEVGIGEYRGMKLSVMYSDFSQKVTACLKGEKLHYCELNPETDTGNIIRLDNCIDNIEKSCKTIEEKISIMEAEMKQMEIDVKKPFPKEEELRAAMARLDEVHAELTKFELTDDTPQKDLYERLCETFPQIFTGECDCMRLVAGEENEPLDVELNGNVLSMSHSLEADGIMLYEPLIEFKIDFENESVIPIRYENSINAVSQQFDPNAALTPESSKVRNSIISFTDDWLDTIDEKEYKPISMSLSDNGGIDEDLDKNKGGEAI